MSVKDIPKERVVNRIRASVDSSFLSEKLAALPSTYYLGVSTVCDIRCPYCPRQFYKEDVDPGLMDFQDFMKMAGCLASGEEAFFFGLGEPFLHPRFFDFIRVSAEAGIRTSTSTHGMSLKPDVRAKILDAGLDELAVSIDAVDEATFEKLRQGARLYTVKENIRSLQKEKALRKLQTPRICIATAVSRHNVDQLSDIVKLGKDLGAIRIIFTDLILVNKEQAGVSVARTDLFHKNFKKAESLGKKHGILILYFYQYPFPWKKDPVPRTRRTGTRYACVDAWKTCIIDRRGDMKPCCYYPPFTGNVFTHALPEIINNDENRQLRRSLLKGEPPECCVSCGMLTEINPEKSLAALTQAEKLFLQAKDSSVLTQKDIDEITGLLSEYHQLFEKYQG